MPQVNPDGTVQVAPPTQSAFAQPPGPPLAPQAQPPQVSSGTPGFGGALLDAIKALAMHFAPKSVTQIKQRNDQAEAKGLGNEF